MTRPKDQRERAARALCRKDGHPENITFEGKPMWMSYLDTVDVVLAELDAEPAWLDPARALSEMPPDVRARFVEACIRAPAINVMDLKPGDKITR